MSRREVRIVQTTRPFEYQSPFPHEEHTVIVCVLDDSVTAEEQARISEQIVASKCRYAVCWGSDCSAWDTAIDCAYIAADRDLHDETFVMTTWHENDSIEDTMEFWWMNTSFGNYEATRFAVLIIGDKIGFKQRLEHLTSEIADRWNRQDPAATKG